MTQSAPKTAEQITQEWQAIEAKRPGGSLSNVAHLLQTAANMDRPDPERNLLEIVGVLHDTVRSYHAEMGVLIAQLAAQAEALEAERERANVLAWDNDGHAEWMTEHHQDLLRELPDSEMTAQLGRLLARWQRTPGQRQYVALSEVEGQREALAERDRALKDVRTRVRIALENTLNTETGQQLELALETITMTLGAQS